MSKVDIKVRKALDFRSVSKFCWCRWK